MRKLLCLFILLAMVSTVAQAVPIWQDDMSVVGDWGQASSATNENDGPELGGIRNQPADGPYTYVQCNSWWDGAQFTNMWRGTGVVIQDETTYDAYFTMESYVTGTAGYELYESVDISLSSIDGEGTWTLLNSISPAPAQGSFNDYIVSFDTIGSNNNAAVGLEIGVGAFPGYWNNLSIDNVAVYIPEPATLMLLGFGGLLLRRRK